jgi:hypothetical protein
MIFILRPAAEPSVVVLGGKDSDKITFESTSVVDPAGGCP